MNKQTWLFVFLVRHPSLCCLCIWHCEYQVLQKANQIYDALFTEGEVEVA